jgi:hypothetical protein
MAGMKPSDAATSHTKPSCQRPGCLNQGRPRSQARNGITRNLLLCDYCFDRLLACQLHDLFLQLGAPVSIGERRRREAVRSTVNRRS